MEQRSPDVAAAAHEDAKIRIQFQVNGESTDVLFDTHKTLLEVLREDLDLTGTKHGCETRRVRDVLCFDGWRACVVLPRVGRGV